MLSGTAFGQTPGRWVLIGGDIVQIPLADLKVVAAKRIVSNELNRERRQSIALLVSQQHDDSVTIAIKDRTIADERLLRTQAYAERDKFAEANVDIQRKLRRRTPWALAMKIELGLILVAGTIAGVNAAIQ